MNYSLEDGDIEAPLVQSNHTADQSTIVPLYNTAINAEFDISESFLDLGKDPYNHNNSNSLKQIETLIVQKQNQHNTLN